jgi:hypothetical protein
VAGAAVAAITLGAAGCGLFHHNETPQQQFTEALSRGNSAQASYIWNSMNARDQATFRRGEGVKPQIDQNSAAAQLEQHQQDESAPGDDDDLPPTVDIPGD